MSFTTGGLYYIESIKIAELFPTYKNWATVRAHAIEQNVLQARTQNTLRRVCSEIISRLKLLTPDEFELLESGTKQEQLHILWLAVCKRYQFIFEFAVEVLREKFLQLDTTLTQSDYNAFFNAKSHWHDELDNLTDTTRQKQKQVIFKMLREAGIITKTNTINPIMLSRHFIEIVSKNSQPYLAAFPISDSEAQKLAI